MYVTLCSICDERPSSGSVGSIGGNSCIDFVCKFCYHYVLEMKPVCEIYQIEAANNKKEAWEDVSPERIKELKARVKEMSS